MAPAHSSTPSQTLLPTGWVSPLDCYGPKWCSLSPVSWQKHLQWDGSLCQYRCFAERWDSFAKEYGACVCFSFKSLSILCVFFFCQTLCFSLFLSFPFFRLQKSSWDSFAKEYGTCECFLSLSLLFFKLQIACWGISLIFFVTLEAGESSLTIALVGPVETLSFLWYSPPFLALS